MEREGRAAEALANAPGRRRYDHTAPDHEHPHHPDRRWRGERQGLLGPARCAEGTPHGPGRTLLRHVRANAAGLANQDARLGQGLGLAAEEVVSTLPIAVTVFQLRVVTGTPKTRSNVPR